MTGALTFAAVSRTALMESVPTQLTAGRAKLFSFATWNTFCTSSPVITPGFTKSKIFRHVSLSCIVGLWEKTRAALNVRSAINQRAGIPARNDYFLARSSSIATAGRTLPSTNSRNAPPPVENVGNFVSNAEQVDCRQGVAAASDGKRFAISDGIRHDFSPFTEVRELKHANRAVPQNGFWHS